MTFVHGQTEIQRFRPTAIGCFEFLNHLRKRWTQKQRFLLENIVVFVNGIPIFNAKDAFSFNNQGVWNQNVVINEADGMDAALGHLAPVMRRIMIQGFVQGSIPPPATG